MVGAIVSALPLIKTEIWMLPLLIMFPYSGLVLIATEIAMRVYLNISFPRHI